MRIRSVAIPMLVLAVLGAAGAFAACGGNDDGGSPEAPTEPAGNGGAQPTDPTEPAGGGGEPTEPAGGQPPAPAEAGEATLALGDETLEFAVEFCAFDSEEAGNENVEFAIIGSEAESNVRLEGGVINTGQETMSVVAVFDLETLESVYESAPVTGDEGFEIDGNDVRFEAEFLDEAGESQGTGVLEGNCPA